MSSNSIVNKPFPLVPPGLDYSLLANKFKLQATKCTHFTSRGVKGTMKCIGIRMELQDHYRAYNGIGCFAMWITAAAATTDEPKTQ